MRIGRLYSEFVHDVRCCLEALHRDESSVLERVEVSSSVHVMLRRWDERSLEVRVLSSAFMNSQQLLFGIVPCCAWSDLDDVAKSVCKLVQKVK